MGAAAADGLAVEGMRPYLLLRQYWYFCTRKASTLSSKAEAVRVAGAAYPPDMQLFFFFCCIVF